MKTQTLSAVVVGLMLTGCGSGVTNAPEDIVRDGVQLKEPSRTRNAFEKLSFTSTEGTTIAYGLFRPERSNGPLPLVLALHGAGGRGNTHGHLGNEVVGFFALAENQRHHPCYVLVPQCGKDDWWVVLPKNSDKPFEEAYAYHEKGTAAMRSALQLLDKVLAENAVDKTRIYVIGGSMGGYGTWDALMRRPGVFAAAVPICGRYDVSKTPQLANVPVWLFHGGADTVIPPDGSRSMVAALQKSGGNPKYTEFPGVPHYCYKSVVAEPGLADWLFSQRIAVR